VAEECVWVEILSSIGLNLRIGNHCFDPDTNADTPRRYFGYLERVLNIHNFRDLLLGDFNISLFYWKLGIPPATSHYYNKLRGGAVFFRHSYSACIIVIISAKVATFVHLVFAYLSINHDLHVLVSLDTYHPSSFT